MCVTSHSFFHPSPININISSFNLATSTGSLIRKYEANIKDQLTFTKVEASMSRSFTKASTN